MTRTVGSYINVRTQPTTRSPRQGYGLRGDRVVILDRQGGLHDGHQWVQVEFPQRGVQGWIRADFVVGTAGAEAAISPAASPAAAPVSVQRSKLRTPSPQTSASPVSTTPVQTAPVSAAPVQAAPTQAAPVRAARPSAALAPSAVQQPSAYGRPTGNRYTADDISYFTEIALGSEFGNATHRIRKWEEDIRIRVHGQPTAADHAALDAVVRDLSGLIAGNNGDGPSIEVVEGARVADANVDMYFVPHQEFRRYEPHYQPGNLGFAYVNWNRDRIHRARILITTVDISQTERDHLIREELTQSLGLLRDSYRHTDSIFYQGWTRTTAFSPLDQRIIQMLYHRDVEPGMTGRQIRAALGQTASIAAR